MFSNNSYRLSSKKFPSTINIGMLLKGGEKTLGGNLVNVNDCNSFMLYQTTIPQTQSLFVKLP